MTPNQRAKFFNEHNGICYLCRRKIAPGEDWHDEHVLATGLGGSNDPKNRRLAHVDCHKPKTKLDVQMMRKADRQAKKHLGIKPRSKWNTRLKRTVDGTVVDRETGERVGR